MKRVFVNPVFLRRGITALLSLLLAFMLFTTAYADPTEEQHGPTYKDGTVHLSATVPEGFGGTVSVQLSNVETGELYTVTCYASAGHDTYDELPLGTYFVERAFTSEDSFIYEAFTEYFEFTLGNFQELTVNVMFNEAAQSYLDEQAEQQSQQSTDLQQSQEQGSEPQESGTTSAPAEDKEVTGEPAKPEDTVQDTAPDDAEGTEEKGSVLEYIGKVVIGTAVFSLLVFGTVFIVRKKMSK